MLSFQHTFMQTLRHIAGAPVVVEALWQDLVHRYGEPHRRYHTLAHLDALVGELERVREQLLDWDALVLATAYHDVIYDAGRQDNEAQSAVHAVQQLHAIVPAETLKAVEALILATKTHTPDAPGDTAYFTDADLAVLGTAPAAYRDYSRAIRDEYRMYPDAQYRPGRAAVLRHFLSREQLYHTREFYQRYEVPARINLTAELQELGGADHP